MTLGYVKNESGIYKERVMAFPVKKNPSDANFLRDMENILRGGGNIDGWVPGRLRIIAGKLEREYNEQVKAEEEENETDWEGAIEKVNQRIDKLPDMEELAIVEGSVRALVKTQDKNIKDLSNTINSLSMKVGGLERKHDDFKDKVTGERMQDKSTIETIIRRLSDINEWESKLRDVCQQISEMQELIHVHYAIWTPSYSASPSYAEAVSVPRPGDVAYEKKEGE